MEEILQFQKGKLYIIINKEFQKALKIEETEVDSRVIGCEVNPEHLDQLWFVEEVKPDDYEITNAVTGYCFDEESGEIRVEKGKKASDQLFAIQKASTVGTQTYYWIKTYKKSKQALTYDDNLLTYRAFNQQDKNQQFRFDPVPTNTILKKASIIQNAKSEKVADLVKHSRKEGLRLVQSRKTRHFNQRWLLFKVAPNIYAFQNLMTKLVMTVDRDKIGEGANIVQCTYTQTPEQHWRLQQKEHGLFIIWSMLQPSLMLGVEDESTKSGEQLELVSKQCKWRFDGFIPFD